MWRSSRKSCVAVLKLSLLCSALGSVADIPGNSRVDSAWELMSLRSFLSLLENSTRNPVCQYLLEQHLLHCAAIGRSLRMGQKANQGTSLISLTNCLFPSVWGFRGLPFLRSSGVDSRLLMASGPACCWLLQLYLWEQLHPPLCINWGEIGRIGTWEEAWERLLQLCTEFQCT